MQNLPTDYQTFIHKSRYARWLEEEQRRETWDETVTRFIDYMVDHIKLVCEIDISKSDDIKAVKQAILDLEIMPSMRSLMTAGPALKRENVAGYNCSYIPIDNPRSFDEVLYILMNGTGVGFSVERQYVNKLPDIPNELEECDTTIVVADSKIGWAKALRELVSLLYQGMIPKVDYSRIREAGSRLKIF